MDSNSLLFWSEKYRPYYLGDVLGNKSIVRRFQTMVNSEVILHMLISGNPGTGKTTLARCFLNEWFTKKIENQSKAMPQWLPRLGLSQKELFSKLWAEAVLEMNASDERKVEVIKTKVHHFATKQCSILPRGVFKIVFLDEVDSMQATAQEALIHVINQCEETTRFILICNQPEKVIEGLHSHMAHIQFQPIEPQELVERIQIIMEHEKLPFTLSENALYHIVDSKQGDARATLNVVQTVCSKLLQCEQVDENSISVKRYGYKEIKDYIPLSISEQVQQLVDYCVQNNSQAALDCLYKLRNQDAEVKQIIDLFYDYLCGSKHHILQQQMNNSKNPRASWNREQLAKKQECLATYHARICQGCDHWIQLVSCIYECSTHTV